MTDLILVLLGAAGVWGSGLVLAQLLLPVSPISSQPKSNLAELLGLGLVLGFGFTALFYLLWGMIGLRYTPGLSYIWMSLGLAGGVGTLFIRYRRLKQNADQLSATSKAEIDFRHLCLGLLLFLAITTVVQTWMTPQRFWDERAIFGLKSIVIFQEATIQNESLLHPDFVQYHPKYPLLIPLNEAHFYLLMGEVNDRWSKIMFPLLYVGMVLTFLGVLSRSTRQSVQAWLFTLMLATVPSMVPWEYGFLSGQADGPVACFHTVALLYLWSFLKTLNHANPDSSVLVRSPLIAGLAAGMTIFTKDEGIAFFLVDLIALSLVTILYFRKRLISTALSIFQFGLTTAIIVAPWFYHRSQLPSTTEMAYFSRMQITTLAEGVSAFFWAVQHLFQCMFLEAWKWGLQWWVLIISLFTFPGKAIKPHQLFLLLNLLGTLAALIIAGMIAPTPVQEHIGGSSLRFLLQISGGAILFIAGQWICEED
ncbi:hypothetical protein [uncultured Gimesia sp.]|uniref:hypothetical protein n=1 Tax=uncultured Gimesia sp. TaxID=1678688 RepID=UPI002634ECBE|nr:hypothetical protein [uncultured Gimesia sp.]